MVKNLPANAGDLRDLSLIPGLGRSPGGGYGNPLQYFCLEISHGQRSLEVILVLLSCGDNGEHIGGKITLARTLADKRSALYISRLKGSETSK